MSFAFLTLHRLKSGTMYIKYLGGKIMANSPIKQNEGLYSVYLAPRGRDRMVDVGLQISQQYLSPFDHIIGIVGDADVGKSMLIHGMFPGLGIINDDIDDGPVPLPLLGAPKTTFYSPHTYHLDMYYESKDTPLERLAEAVLDVAAQQKRVVVEHFEVLYPVLHRNADLLIGVGEEIIVARPSLMGPDPQNIADLVHKSIRYRRMAHSAEDLCALIMGDEFRRNSRHSEVRHGFVLEFDEKPTFDIEKLESDVKDMIAQDLPITYVDPGHVKIGDSVMVCQAPKLHVKSTGEIEEFSLVKEFQYDSLFKYYMMIAQIGKNHSVIMKQMNRIQV